MRTLFFEVTNGFNWGKFAVGFFDEEEWDRPSVLPAAHEGRLLTCLGWGRSPRDEHTWVMDLQTGEGMYVRLGGCATYDLNGKHQIWVCPLFEPFLTWLYKQDPDRLEELSGQLVTLTEEDAPSSLSGYRRHRYAAFQEWLKKAYPEGMGNGSGHSFWHQDDMEAAFEAGRQAGPVPP